MREAQNRKLFPAENALVNIPAFMMLGSTGYNVDECETPRRYALQDLPLMPARVMARTKGDCAAFPVAVGDGADKLREHDSDSSSEPDLSRGQGHRTVQSCL
jgi:hypothetical protein